MKIKLVKFAEDIFNHMLTPKFTQVVSETFDVETFDVGKTYNKNSTVFCASIHHYDNHKSVIDNLIDSDYKIVIENLHETGVELRRVVSNNVLTLACGLSGPMTIHVPMFFWYDLYKPWDRPKYVTNYKRLIRKNNFDKKFLMLMNNISTFRDQIYTKFSDILNNSYYSYYQRGIRIFGDKEILVDLSPSSWDRYVNVEWYNRTQFSVVVETDMVLDSNTFLTEKTMKPLALKHPFITLGNTGSLALLKSAGFETFENIFDESYDSIPNYLDRIDNVYNQVKNYKHSGYSKLTEDKIEHNYNLFHNDAEVARRFKRDVIDPILEFANATP
jgi:hypothetical protein